MYKPIVDFSNANKILNPLRGSCFVSHSTMGFTHGYSNFTTSW